MVRLVSMILNSKILNKLINSGYIKNIYPMIDHIQSTVLWDGDNENPVYDIILDIYTNIIDINHRNMYEKGLDPHYLVDHHIISLLKFVSVNSRDINQFYIKVMNKNGVVVYG